MSDTTDDYIERFFFDSGLAQRSPGNFQKGAGKFKWRTKDMRVISMHSMTDDHLRNAHAHALRMGWTGKAEQLQTVLTQRMPPAGLFSIQTAPKKSPKKGR